MDGGLSGVGGGENTGEREVGLVNGGGEGGDEMVENIGERAADDEIVGLVGA